MAIKLLERGISDFIILEKSNGFGGTWKDNVYPGCCCDGKRRPKMHLHCRECYSHTDGNSVYSHLYSYSFEQNPSWSRLYPQQSEILVGISICIVQVVRTSEHIC